MFANLPGSGNNNAAATTASAAQPPSSLFPASTATNQQPSLLSAPNATSAPPNPGSTATATSQAQQQPGFGNSLLGGSQALQANQSAQQQGLGQSQTRDPAHFNSLLERQRKRQRFGTTPGQDGVTRSLPNLNMDLGDLARRAQEIGRAGRNAKLGTGADSRAHYLLAGSGVAPGQATQEFEREEREGQPAGPSSSADTFDPDNEKYLRGLRERGREAMIQEAIDRVHRDFDAHLEETLDVGYEQQKKIMQHFGLLSRDDTQQGDAKPNGQGAFGRSAGTNVFNNLEKESTRSVFGKSGLNKSLIGNPALGASTTTFFRDSSSLNGDHAPPAKGQNLRSLRDKERYFLNKIQKMNEHRMQDDAFPILREFAMVEDQAGETAPRQLVDAYQALVEMTHEPPQILSFSDPSAIRERHFASSYLVGDPHSPKSVAMRRRILEGSRTYLEQSFYRELESIIEKNPREAQVGGRPTVINKIRAYVRVRAARKDLAPDEMALQQIGDNGDYCWVLIFYLLRCGFVQEALEYVNHDSAFQSTDKKFVSYLTNYANSPNRKLSKKLQDLIHNEYQQRLRNAPENTLDPYRMACYKIIGRCDLHRRNLHTVGQGVEDWIWLQFNLARETVRGEELAGEIFGLDQICETVQEIGQKHFQEAQTEGSGGYGVYFFMQVLAGMFEPAVAYLHSYNPASAVHFAIALDYYGLLRVSNYSVAGNELGKLTRPISCLSQQYYGAQLTRKRIGALVTRTTADLPQINFLPLVAYYTASFRTALPVAAVDYLVLIALNADLPGDLGVTQITGCHECLRQLCLETREFAQLLGDIRTDGTRIPGAIELRSKLIKLDTHTDFLNAVTIQAAAVADERSHVADAVLLYHLCEDYDNGIRVLNSALAEVVSVDLGETPSGLQPLKPQPDASTEGSSDGSGHGDAAAASSSLSLTQSATSVQQLAENMIALYNSNALYYNRISTQHRNTCALLLRLISARSHLESDPPRFMDALDEIHSTNLLPLQAEGSIPTIRASAAQFGGLPSTLARCTGIALVWAVMAIGGERDRLTRQGGVWDGGGTAESSSMEMVDRVRASLSGMAKDLMVFAGLVKYKLPGRVYDMLTRAGGEVGVY